MNKIYTSKTHDSCEMTEFQLELYLHRNLISTLLYSHSLYILYFSINFVTKGRESEIVRSYINQREFVDHDTYNVSSDFFFIKTVFKNCDSESTNA